MAEGARDELLTELESERDEREAVMLELVSEREEREATEMLLQDVFEELRTLRARSCPCAGRTST